MSALLIRTAFLLSVTTIILNGVYCQNCENNAPCVVLQQCPRVLQMLTRGPVSEETKAQLRNLRCGYDGSRPMVCCANQASLLPSVCGMQDADRIVGGTETEVDEHPWVALLGYNAYGKSSFSCGAVLISSRYVLTAAHCVTGPILANGARQLTHVRLGEYDTSRTRDCPICQDALDVPVEKVIPHEGYVASSTHQHDDIALVRLAREVTFTDYIRPVCLPEAQNLRSMSFTNTEAEAVGWGKTEEDRKSDVKKKVRLTVVNNNVCSQRYRDTRRQISSRQICAGGMRGQDTCRGDSGGPLVGQLAPEYNWYALGVVSYGPTPCGTPGWPGVYTRVTSYMQWILSNLEP